LIRVTLVTNGKVMEAKEPGNLLRMSIRYQGEIPFKCGAGICGTCRCKIELGLPNTDAVKPKERNHLSEAELAEGYRMACQTFIEGDVSVSWVPLKDRPPKAVPPKAGP
jgi:ferredoxin